MQMGKRREAVGERKAVRASGNRMREDGKMEKTIEAVNVSYIYQTKYQTDRIGYR